MLHGVGSSAPPPSLPVPFPFAEDLTPYFLLSGLFWSLTSLYSEFLIEEKSCDVYTFVIYYA